MKVFTILLGVVFAGVTGHAMATQDTTQAYLGIKAGYNSIENSCYNYFEECENNNISYGLFGGYQFNNWFALELDAINYQDYKARYKISGQIQDWVKADAKSLGTSIKLSQPFTQDLSGYIRIGASYIDVNRESLPTNNNWSPMGSIGFEYQFTPMLFFRAEYTNHSDISGSSGHFTSLGLSYHFKQDTKRDIPSQVSVKKTSVMAKNMTHSLMKIDPIIRQKIVAEKPVGEILLSSMSFSFDSYALTSRAERALNKVVTTGLKTPQQAHVWISGHTDSAGTKAYNQALSEKRAQSVANYFIHKGIKASTIHHQGKGESSPISSNRLAEGRAQNRRVDIIIQGELPPKGW